MALAERELLDAKLELATSKRERTAIREAGLEFAKDREAQIARRVEMGDLANDATLKAKAHRLRANIDLQLEKQEG